MTSGANSDARHRTHRDLMAAWHWLTTGEEDGSGFNTFFSGVRGALRPSDTQARRAIGRRLADTCVPDPCGRDPR